MYPRKQRPPKDAFMHYLAKCKIVMISCPAPAFPELPSARLSPAAFALGYLVAPLYPPEEDRYAGKNERDHDERFERLRKDCSAE